jgi:hypothetical protein
LGSRLHSFSLVLWSQQVKEQKNKRWESSRTAAQGPLPYGYIYDTVALTVQCLVCARLLLLPFLLVMYFLKIQTCFFTFSFFLEINNWPTLLLSFFLNFLFSHVVVRE